MPVVAAVVLALLIPAASLAAFGAGTPYESPRLNTPNDPEFDACEGDNDGGPTCATYADEEFRAFGFSPDSANQLPAAGPHYATGTRYTNCAQLDPQGQQANVQAESAGNAVGDEAAKCLQIGGVRADSAWKFSTGDPDVAVAILDTGIRWQSTELVNKVRLNTEELPLPLHDRATPTAPAGGPCNGYAAAYDANGDGAVNVLDYACDLRVRIAQGDTESDGILDASDLIARFSDGVDDDDGGAGNAFIDDIAGWDFFDDDNDPYDASSCCSANGHGTGRATEAVGETNNANAGVGMCPECQLIPLRVWDTFVVPTDNYAMGVVYAANNGASVVEGAVGGLTNTQFARSAFSYADEKGVALTLVSSDINSANHNYPTNYNEAIYVAGSLYDTAPNNTCSGPGGLPGLPDLPGLPGDFADGCNEFLGFLQAGGGISAAEIGQPTTTSFFRNSNLTQYGGKSDVVLMGATGSENTGQASGAAGLLASFGREELAAPLSGNEIRQLMTMTAEDVQPENTGVIGLPDKANEGWDPHFGYGRLNLAGAMARIANERGPAPRKGTAPTDPYEWPCADADETCVPPEAQIDSPDWYTPVNVDRVPNEGIVVEGFAAAPHAAINDVTWELEYACGQDALDADFGDLNPPVEGDSPVDGVLGNLPKPLLEDLAANCEGEVENDAGRPAGGSAADGVWPADPYPTPDPERHAFQIRLTVHEAANPGNIGRYRKTLFAYEDDGNLDGWPRAVGKGSLTQTQITRSGGEVSPRLYDVDGDNKLDVVQGNSSGELYVLRSDGTPLPSFNGGDPVRTRRYEAEMNHPVPPELAGAVPHESLRVPAIGDIDGDREPEIVASAGEHVYAWEADGDEVDGFPVRIDPALSDPCIPPATKPCFDVEDRAITGSNHIKRGIFGSVALGDINDDGRLDIVSGSMDQHVYAWDGTGAELSGFPAKLASDGADGAEIVASPAIAQLDGTGPPEIVLATNEVIPGENPSSFPPFFDFFGAALRASTGANPVYALHGDGTPVDGWPVTVPVAAGDLLPLVLPSHDAAVLDVFDGDTPGSDGTDEVSVSGGTGVIGAQGAFLVNGDGTTRRNYQNAPAPNLTDQGPILNLADYPSIGDLSGAGSPLVLKGGLTVNGAANLLAVNQNLPFNHVEQAWNPTTGQPQPGFPRATDDFQLVSQAAVATVAAPATPPAPGAEAPAHVLVGTGLYQLHAYGPDGMDAPGWPKFTGGWTQTTPAVGDVDGDGDLDVSVTTREGWSFLWDTQVDACGGSNDEWPSFHHDEFGSANYGTDARPPGTPTGLEAVRADDGFDLSWSAPGDDWLCGEAESYRVLLSADPIEHPSDADRELSFSVGGPVGGAVTRTLNSADVGDARYAAVLYRDDAGNWGHLSSTPLPGTASGPPSPSDPPGPANPDDPSNPDAPSGPSNPDGPTDSSPCSERIAGTDGVDRLVGSIAGERIVGKGGSDRISAGAGDDCVAGGGGNDRIKGGDGDDKLTGQKGNDRVGGDDGDDRVRGGDGNDRLKGGNGKDRIQGKGGRDRISGGRGSDVLRGGQKPDRISGGPGNDSIEVVGGGADVVNCGSGKDTVRAGRSDRVAKSCEKVKRG